MEPMEAGATAAEAAARHRTLPALRTFTVGRTPMVVAATLNMFPTAESTYQTRQGGPRRRYSREVRSALGVALLAPTLVGVTVERGERAGRRLPSTSASVSIAARKAPKTIQPDRKSRPIDSIIDRSDASTKISEISAPKHRDRGGDRGEKSPFGETMSLQSLSWRSFRFENALTGFRVKKTVRIGRKRVRRFSFERTFREARERVSRSFFAE